MSLLGIIIFAYLVFANPDNVQVPNVVGQELSTAQTKIEGAGFKVGEVKEVEDDSVDTGKVIKTDLAGTTKRIKHWCMFLLVVRVLLKTW